MRVAIVGGGPAGLYFARLFKRSRPDADIHLYEQGPEGATWGFGVGLGSRTLAEVESADPVVHARLVAAMQFTREQVISLNGEAIKLEYTLGTGSISRLEMLRILIEAGREVGVNLHFEAAVDSARQLEGADLIVAADGANSRLRAEREREFGTHRRVLTNHFAWYGVARRLHPSALVFRSFEGGSFIGHYYAYAEDLSTFVAECDDATWQRLGFEAMSDDQRKAFIERVFAPELSGSPLISNRSIWRCFPATGNRHFHTGNVVLLGDSLRAAHFSIGSGTRLAMEDAAALHYALIESDGDVANALPRFERLRRPGRDKFAEAARQSFEWYEDVARHMAQPLMPFVYGFLTRTGRISDDRLRSYVPNFYNAYRQHLMAEAS